ncbi:hypothetical protein [Tautonia sociabilis]|uniref:Uncharacterized protein n=1 Tax=Tautonia sociabilis TaxID=2080755 RepID=A0A432MQ34_9BACT|nr:hypothetical protein [Tautonia sociabilis]RUL89257.1 hypothetical protein TsocGM_02225 [Tautonia sociabilis]
MRATFAIFASTIGSALIGLPALPSALAEGPYSTEVLAEAPPEELAGEIRETLQERGVRVRNADGEPVFDIWLCASVPAQAEIGGPSGSVLYPFLTAGQLVGAVRLSEEAYDYKDQSILPGVYTMRYGLQPVDGNHLGVSKYRDYLLLSLADEDIEAGPISQDDLQALSTGPSGTNHPAIFLLLPAPEGGEVPAIVPDEAEERTGLVLELPVAPQGGGEPEPLAIQLVIEGAGPH